MNLSEQFVASALESLGYFLIQGLKVGVREADFLAVRLDKDRLLHYHIEVQISYNPVGVLRAHARLGRTGNDPLQAADEYIEKKFFQKDVIKAIECYFKTKMYKKIFIYNRLRDSKQLRAFSDKGIECIKLQSLINQAEQSSYRTDAFVNFRNLANAIAQSATMIEVKL